MKSGVLVITLLFFNLNFSHAGRLLVEKDDFTGETTKAYVSTEKEMALNGAVYVITNYDSQKNTVVLAVRPLSGATDCNNKYLLLKDSEGKIHKLDADEKGFNKCIVYSLDAELVKKPFRLRIPIYNGSNLDIDVDTATLDLSLL